MGFLSLLKSILGTPAKAPAPVRAEARSATSATPAAPPAVAPAAPASAPAAVSTPDVAAIVTRSEIVDERHRLCGYRFSAPVREPALFDALTAARVAEFAQRRLALVPITLEAVSSGWYLPLVAPNTIFLLDCKAAGAEVEALLAAMAALRGAGARVALRGVTLEDTQLLLKSDLIALYLNEHVLADLQTLAKQLHLRYPGLSVLVDSVDTWDEQRMCASWGCSYFMGHFLTTNDQVDPDAKIDQSRMTSIELLNLLRSDAELSAMIEVAKRDPGMTYQLLQWANAPASGQSGKVTSLQQAFMVLGRNQLYRILTVSMFRLGAGANRERDESLLEVALTRARFLETCSQLPAAKRDELFLVGLLSLFDVLLKVPMEKLLADMHLSSDIRDVLLGSEGVYSPYLMLVLLLERDKVERAMAIAEKLDIDVARLPATGQAAFQWAQASLQHTGAG